jgi:Homeodomain-like domain
MDETQREQIALFRYGVISELVSRSLAPREKEKLLAAIAAKTWVLPGSRRTQIGRTTVRDWIVLYQRHGFDGLKPGQRADVGKPRAIPEPAQELLLALRAERPGASIDSLIRAVQLSGRVEPTLRLSRSSVHRFFAAQAPPAPACERAPSRSHAGAGCRPLELAEGVRGHPLHLYVVSASKHHPEPAAVPRPRGQAVRWRRWRWLGRRGGDVGVCRFGDPATDLAAGRLRYRFQRIDFSMVPTTVKCATWERSWLPAPLFSSGACPL